MERSGEKYLVFCVKYKVVQIRLKGKFYNIVLGPIMMYGWWMLDS